MKYTSRIALIFAIIFSISNILHAQTLSEKLHIGIGMGPMRYYGDVFNEYTQFSIAGNLRYELNDHFSLKGQITLGSVGASDANSGRDAKHPFRSNIQEISIMPEYDLFNMNKGKKWTPYIFVGVSYFHYTPFHYVYNEETNRYDKMDGSNDPNYRLSSVPRKLNIPFGGGFKYGINDNIRLFAEANMRLTNTDEIDAFNVKSSSYKNDVYYNFLFGVTFRLGGDYKSKNNGNKSGKHNSRNMQNCPPVYL